MREREVAVRPVQETDRPTVEWLTTQLWGAAEVVVHDGAFYPAALPGFIAERAGRIAGLVTFDVRPGVLEIVTINALDQFAGIGTLLIEAVRAEAKRLGCQQITLTTTNDNIAALRFYQRRGFRVAALRPGAVDRSRLRKPEIPRTGDFGIPLRDEIDLTCPVLRKTPKAILPNVRFRLSSRPFLNHRRPPAGFAISHSVSGCVLSRSRPILLYKTYDCPREHDVANR